MLADVHERQCNVGFAAALAKDGELVFSQTIGHADLDPLVPVGHDTRFLVASITKAFTGTAVLLLGEAGALDVEAPIQKYVPAFPHGGVTVEKLAAHVAGVRHYRDGEKTPEFLSTHFDDVDDALRLFSSDPLVAEPGTSYQYSSYGYNLLAAAVQSAAGRPFDEFVSESIFQPLGLEATTFHDVRCPPPGLARGYSFFDPFTSDPLDEFVAVPELDYSYNAGGGNLVTTVKDLVRFGSALLAPGFLSAEGLRHATTSIAVESPWSYGWILGSEDTLGERLRINGAIPGFQAGLAVYPGAEVVIAVASNTWGIGADSGELVMETLDEAALAYVRSPNG